MSNFNNDYVKLLQTIEEHAKAGVIYPKTLVDDFMEKYSLKEGEEPMTELEYNTIKSAYYGF